jgi:hypothetical protein
MSKPSDSQREKVPVTWEDIIRGTDEQEKKVLLTMRAYSQRHLKGPRIFKKLRA